MSKSYIPAELRRSVAKRAKNCCEYCLQPEFFSLSSHAIDHIIAEKHNGQTIESNLALACKLCNTIKGSDIASIDPETQETTPLYHPRRDLWQEHFQLQDAELIGLTAKARTTIWLLRLNQSDRMQERKLGLSEGFITVPA
jgi:hypothetical protein